MGIQIYESGESNVVVPKLLLGLFALMAAPAIGLYVYPTQPGLVWGLLFFCWGCYRLGMRAEARFGPARRKQNQNDTKPQ